MMPIAASEVAVAGRCDKCANEQEQRHDHDPAADAEERAEEAGDETDQDQAHAPIFEGWMRRSCCAPGSRRPGEAAISRRRRRARADRRAARGRSCPAETRAAARAARRPLRARRRVSGGPERRRAASGRRRRRRRSSASTASSSTARPRLAAAIADFADTVAWPAERKRLSVAFHFRTAEDEQAAVRELRRVAERARRRRAEAALGPQGARGPPAGRRGQGHGRAATARGARPAARARTRATTRPISTRSAAWTASSSPSASPSRPTRGRNELGEARRPRRSAARTRSSAFCAGSLDARRRGGARADPRALRRAGGRSSGRERSPSASARSRPTTRSGRTT